MADKIDGKGQRGGLRTRGKRGGRNFSPASAAAASAEVANGSAHAQGPSNLGSNGTRVQMAHPLSEANHLQAMANASSRVPPRQQAATARDEMNSIAARTAERELPLYEARALLAQLHERVASIASISDPQQQGLVGSIWGDLARCDEKIAQAQGHQRSLEGEGEDARRTLDD
ncbi:hypothetical protein ABG067_008114, partial [Albugo candida]